MSELPQQIVSFIPNLRRYARSLTRDRTAADDLVQDTMVKALSRTHLFEPGTHLRAWLFAIQYHLFISGIRRAKNQPDRASFEDAPGRFADPHARIYLREIEAGLGALPAEQRAVLTLSALEGMSYEEIADVTSVPVGTVRSRLSRARERLRDHMGEASRPAPRGLRAKAREEGIASQAPA